MTTPELKPCPYCGFIEVNYCWYPTLAHAYIRCPSCGVHGPRRGTNTGAAEAWNNMARNYELDELVVELGKRAKAMHRLARALRVKNRALAIAQRECKYAQERAAKMEARTLQWTTETPTEAGWYWQRRDKEDTPLPVRVENVSNLPTNVQEVHSLPANAQWAGPILNPVEGK